MAVKDIPDSVAGMTQIFPIGEFDRGHGSQGQRRGVDRLAALRRFQADARNVFPTSNSVECRAPELLTRSQVQRLDAGERRDVGLDRRHPRDQACQSRQRNNDEGDRSQPCRRSGQGGHAGVSRDAQDRSHARAPRVSASSGPDPAASAATEAVGQKGRADDHHDAREPEIGLGRGARLSLSQGWPAPNSKARDVRK